MANIKINKRTQLQPLEISDITGLQGALDEKLTKNTAIDAGTFTKVTVDENGLVTKGEVLTEADIPALSLDKVTNLNTKLEEITTASSGLGTRLDTVETDIASIKTDKLDKSALTNVITDVTWNQTTAAISTTVTKLDVATGTSTPTTITLQEASATQIGLMPAASFAQITANTAAIEALQNMQTVFPATGLPKADAITAADLNKVIQDQASRAPKGGDTVDDLTNGGSYRYYANDTTGIDGSGWHETTSPISIATNDTPGMVQGSTEDGKAFAENDGTLSINGWDTLKSQVSDNTTTLEGKQNKLTAGTGIDITENTISAKIMTGATAEAAGTVGLVPASTAGATNRFLRVDGTWQAVAQPTRHEIDLSSQCDGTKLAFTLTEEVGTDFDVFYNGMRLKNNKNYTLAGTTLTLTLSYAPEAGEDLDVIYRK